MKVIWESRTRYHFEYGEEDESVLQEAWDNDPTRSKSRYHKLYTAMRKAAYEEALEARGLRRGKPHWCGGSQVIYDLETWNHWDKANPDPKMAACSTTKEELT